MKSISNSLVESLKTLGLTEYEAKVYSALVLFDRTEVKQIYEYLDAPKPSVYQSLKTLTDKGLVQVVNAKPAIYRALPPKIALKHMTEIHRRAEDSALLELDMLEKSRVEREPADVLWTVYGEESIEHSVEELLGKAKKSVKLLLPDDYFDYLELLRDRDISTDIITYGSAATIPERYGLRRAIIHDILRLDPTDFMPLAKYFSQLPISGEQLKQFLVIMVDDEEFIYIPPIPSATRSGLTSRNPFIVSLVNLIYGVICEHAPAVFPVK
jgi:HTH-type transcriptional regulator, sugar sensing transcriptional regulator